MSTTAGHNLVVSRISVGLHQEEVGVHYVEVGVHYEEAGPWPVVYSKLKSPRLTS